MKHKTSVVRRETFNAAHRLFKKEWGDEKNRQVFGACSNPNWHGHNYTVEVKISGYVDEETGFLFDLKILKQIIHSQVIDRFDHKNLNLDTAEFASLNPTAENIAMVIYQLIREKVDDVFEVHIRLYETERNVVEYPAVS